MEPGLQEPGTRPDRRLFKARSPEAPEEPMIRRPLSHRRSTTGLAVLLGTALQQRISERAVSLLFALLLVVIAIELIVP